MRRAVLSWCLVAAVAILAGYDARAQTHSPRVWFCPGPGTLDYIRLFEHPEEWPRARRLTSVFKFYQQHTLVPPDSIVGPDTYDALAQAGAFRLLKEWGIETAIEVASVKEFFCTPDARGMNESIDATLRSVRAVEAAGGAVSYLAMDEPFVSGRARVCGGPALEPTADRVATYTSAVRSAFPSVKIGLIEAYPFSSADALESIITLLKARGAAPAFLHMDVDWHLSGRDAFKRDLKRLQLFCAAQGIAYGVLITGYNGDANALYAVDVAGITELIAETFGTWPQMPDHLIVQSFVSSSTGLRITPSNLPQSQLFTHTQMLGEVFRRLRGSTGAATDRAIRRR
jgi:hypothetical protein